jgi:hypothetical protein
MADTFDSPGNYKIEVSGWGLDNSFFVEKTELLWSQTGDKYALLHRALPEGAMIFVRLLDSGSMRCSVPVAYQVEGVRPMDCNGLCEVRLSRLQPRSKAPNTGVSASYMREDSLNTCEPGENSTQLEPEEILQ